MNKNQYAIYHTGVPGMRWGHRKSNSESGSGKESKPKKVNVKNMSDDDLRKIVNRMQMERQYSQLSTSSVSKGKAAVQNMLKAGTTVAAVTTTGLTIYNNATKIKDIIEKTKK